MTMKYMLAMVLAAVILATSGCESDEAETESNAAHQVAKQSIYAAGADGFFKTYPDKFRAACRGIETGAWEQSERLAEAEGIPGDQIIAISTYLYRHCDFR